MRLGCASGLYVLKDGHAVEAELLAWGAWMQDPANRRVARDRVGDVLVSTVFLGVDHCFDGDGPPALWETAVRGGPLDGEDERYTSHDDALAGHAAMLARVRIG